MELTLISVRASGTSRTGKHWATPYISSQLAASRARPRSGIHAGSGLDPILAHSSSRSLSLPAFLAPFSLIVVTNRIFFS